MNTVPEFLKTILENDNRWTPEAFKKFNVQLAGHQVKIPLWGPNTYRVYDMKEPSKSKRLSNPFGTKATLFGNIEANELICVEGEWDLFAAVEAGISNVFTGTNGAGTFTNDMAAMLAGKSISLVYDNDKAGKEGAAKACKALQNQGCKVRIVSLPPEVGAGGDVRDFLKVLGKSKYDLLNIIQTTPWQEAQASSENLPTVHRLSEVTVKEVEWLWKKRIPIGAPTVVAGEPGVGKSYFMAFLAANISTGGFLKEDFSEFSRGPVLYFNMEDSLESTIKSRIQDANADQEVIFVVNEKIEFDDEGKKKIRKIIEDCKPILVIFDPIASFIGADVNMNAANQVRSKMEFTINLARDYNLSVVCVMHTNKNEQQTNLLNRTTGSTDFIGSVRSVLMVVKHPVEQDLRLLGHIKSNLSSIESTLSYKIADGTHVEITNSDERPLDQILKDFEYGSKARAAKGEAKDFLIEVLKSGPMKVPDVIEDAKQNGIAVSTLNRARKDVAEKRKISLKGPGAKGGYWIVYLKEDHDKYKNLGHLDLLALWGDEQINDVGHQHSQDNQDISPEQATAKVKWDGSESSMKGEP